MNTITNILIILLMLASSALAQFTSTATRITSGNGVPSTGCTKAADVGKVYYRKDTGATGASSYGCSKTGASTYAWEYLGMGANSGSALARSFTGGNQAGAVGWTLDWDVLTNAVMNPANSTHITPYITITAGQTSNEFRSRTTVTSTITSATFTIRATSAASNGTPKIQLAYACIVDGIGMDAPSFTALSDVPLSGLVSTSKTYSSTQPVSCIGSATSPAMLYVKWIFTAPTGADLNIAEANLNYDIGAGLTGANGAGFNGRGTYAQMTSSSPSINDTWQLTDATASGACSAGGGTAKSECVWNGSAWVVNSGSAGGGGTPGGSSGDLQYNSSGSFAGLSPTDDNILVGSGTAWVLKSIPSCQDTVGSHLNYNSTTNTFSCGTTAPVFNSITHGYFAFMEGITGHAVNYPQSGSIYASEINVPYAVTFTQLATYISGTTGAAYFSIALYDISGNKILASPGYQFYSSGTRTVSVAQTTIQPGVYIFATSSNTTSTTDKMYTPNLSGSWVVGGRNRTFTCANGSVDFTTPGTPVWPNTLPTRTYTSGEPFGFVLSWE